MRLICPQCGAEYDIDAQLIPPTGRKVECSSCGHGWHQSPLGQTEDGAPILHRPLDASVLSILREEAAISHPAARSKPAPLPPTTEDDGATGTMTPLWDGGGHSTENRGTEENDAPSDQVSAPRQPAPLNNGQQPAPKEPAPERPLVQDQSAAADPQPGPQGPEPDTPQPVQNEPAEPWFEPPPAPRPIRLPDAELLAATLLAPPPNGKQEDPAPIPTMVEAGPIKPRETRGFWLGLLFSLAVLATYVAAPDLDPDQPVGAALADLRSLGDHLRAAVLGVFAP